jgi:hypothetical protein
MGYETPNNGYEGYDSIERRTALAMHLSRMGISDPVSAYALFDVSPPHFAPETPWELPLSDTQDSPIDQEAQPKPPVDLFSGVADNSGNDD